LSIEADGVDSTAGDDVGRDELETDVATLQAINDDNIWLGNEDDYEDDGQRDDRPNSDNEDYEHCDDGGDDDDDDDAIPWHHMQLYQLYGDEADYFLHPKIDSDKRVSATPLKFLKNHCGVISEKGIGKHRFYFPTENGFL